MTMGFVAGHLGTGAGIAGGDVALDKASDLWPVEVERDNLKRLCLSKMACRDRVMALSENLELDRILVGHIDQAIKEHEAVAEAEAFELSLDGVVSGHRGISEERQDALESGVLQLGRTDVADELGFVASGMAYNCRELELTGLEERARRGFGGFAPLRKVLSSRQGIRLAHGRAWPVDDLEVVVGKELGPSGLASAEDLGRGEVLEVPVVRENGERVSRALQV